MPKENNLIAMGQDAHTPYARDTTCQDCRHMSRPANSRPIKRRSGERRREELRQVRQRLVLYVDEVKAVMLSRT